MGPARVVGWGGLSVGRVARLVCIHSAMMACASRLGCSMHPDSRSWSRFRLRGSHQFHQSHFIATRHPDRHAPARPGAAGRSSHSGGSDTSITRSSFLHQPIIISQTRHVVLRQPCALRTSGATSAHRADNRCAADKSNSSALKTEAAERPYSPFGTATTALPNNNDHSDKSRTKANSKYFQWSVTPPSDGRHPTTTDRSHPAPPARRQAAPPWPGGA